MHNLAKLDRPGVVWFSSVSGNTARFVSRLSHPGCRVPISPRAPVPAIEAPFVLICPTYADGTGAGAVPKQIIRFLNDPERRKKLCGVIAGGNRNFGQAYGLAGRIIAEKCNVPWLCSFELAGTDADVALINQGLEKLWRSQCLMMA